MTDHEMKRIDGLSFTDFALFYSDLPR